MQKRAKSQMESAKLHLWQLRNFHAKEESSVSNVDVRYDNIAQTLSALHDDTNNGSTQSLASVLFMDEMNMFNPNSFEADNIKHQPLPGQSKLATKLNEIYKNEDYQTMLKPNCQAPLNCMQKLLSTSYCNNGWLQEIEDNPSVKLIKQKTIQSYSKSSNSSGYQKENNNSLNASSTFRQTSGYPLLSTNRPRILPSEDVHQSLRDSKRKFDDANDCNEEETPMPASCFKSAREQLSINQNKKFQRNSPQGSCNKKSLGSRPRNQCFAKFVPPSSKDADNAAGGTMFQKQSLTSQTSSEEISPKLKGIEPQLIELVMSEIMDHGPPIGWDDIAGLDFAKATIKEVVIWPMLRPDIFTGLRGPPKGILLFGPPGTGKTLIGKCIANQSGATFFSISASSLTSKWIGQAEKMVRALFAVASMHQPAVIFIDEIDSLLSQRSDSEHESSRRIKTEFFVQLDGATTSSEDRILVVGATNRPQEIDEAARRRLVKRLYIPLPDAGAREQIITKLMTQQPCMMSEKDIDGVVLQTDGYSGADVTNLCKDAALGPIRSLQVMDISKIDKNDVRPINVEDFRKSIQRVKASVSQKDLLQYEEWNNIYGCGSL